MLRVIARKLARGPAAWGALAAVALAGCAETEFLMQGAKEISGSTRPEALVGSYKVGKPYAINGVWYYPGLDLAYRETGIASWYGPNFHGKPTANGEVFDMNAISAAHRTLPLPSVVRVTNLENGRSIKVRVNDRGPFARGRIIDLSRRAAQLLDFERQGTAKVRVEILADESRRLASAMGVALAEAETGDEPPPPTAAPRVAVSSETLPPPDGAASTAPPTASHRVEAISAPPPSTSAQAAPPQQALDTGVTVVPVEPRQDLFVQAGAFTRYDNANRVRAWLSTVGKAEIYQVRVKETPYFRVRLGPLPSVAEADRLLESVVGAGYPDARIVVD